jgi:hypothetical protein
MHLVSESEAEPFNSIGVTLPGLPIVAIGHNEHIAWGYEKKCISFLLHTAKCNPSLQKKRQSIYHVYVCMSFRMTVSMVDLKDHFVERFYPNGTYEYKGRALQPLTRDEIILIKGKPAHVEHVVEVCVFLMFIFFSWSFCIRICLLIRCFFFFPFLFFIIPSFRKDDSRSNHFGIASCFQSKCCLCTTKVSTSGVHYFDRILQYGSL